MKQVLINELTRPAVDVPRLNSLIENGKPYKLFGFIDWGVEEIGLFDTYKGQNIFHYLSYKGALSMVLPTFFGSKSQGILSREKVPLSKLNECINVVNLSGLTPAHIAVIHNPTALQTLHQVGAILTSQGYAAILQQNGGRAVAFSPLEYIFQDEATAHNFLTQNIRAGCTDIFMLLNNEHPKVQKQLLKYLPYIVEEVNKINTVNSNNVFTIIFQDYWPDILTADHNSFTKVMRLMNVLNDRNKDWNLSIEDWSQLLSVENFENSSQIRQYILRKCAAKFLDGTLSAIQLEDFINAEAIEDGKFQQLKHFIEGSPSPVSPVEVSAVDITVDQRVLGSVNESEVDLSVARASAASIVDENIRQLSTNPVEHVTALIDDGVLRTLDSAVILGSVKLEERHSVQEHKEKELDDVEAQRVSAIPTPSLSLMSQPASKPFIKPKVVTKVVSIEEYAESVTSCLRGSQKCTEHLKHDLGVNYTQLHCFISMLALSGDYFGKVLHAAAKQLGVATKNTSDFLSEYIWGLEAHDFLTTDNSKKLSAYGLACARDQVDLAKLLLNKGFELGVYSGSTASIFEIPIKYNSTGIIEHLLNEQDSIMIDWRYILSQAIKYANTKAIGYYISSGSDVVQDITDRSGFSTEHGKYNMLNKALDGLTELSELRRFQQDKVKKEAAVKKIPKLCECIEMIIESDKVYYAEENWTVSKKTFSLLKELKSAIKILSDDPSMAKVVEAISHIKDLVISHYESCELPLMARQLLEKLKSSVDDDTVSNATLLTHFSALSDLGRTGQFDDELELRDASSQSYASGKQDEEDKENVFSSIIRASDVAHVKPLSSIVARSSATPIVDDSMRQLHANPVEHHATLIDTGVLHTPVSVAVLGQSADDVLGVVGSVHDKHE